MCRPLCVAGGGAWARQGIDGGVARVRGGSRRVSEGCQIGGVRPTSARARASVSRVSGSHRSSSMRSALSPWWTTDQILIRAWQCDHKGQFVTRPHRHDLAGGWVPPGPRRALACARVRAREIGGRSRRGVRDQAPSPRSRRGGWVPSGPRRALACARVRAREIGGRSRRGGLYHAVFSHRLAEGEGVEPSKSLHRQRFEIRD